jgi:hypothetical protein
LHFVQQHRRKLVVAHAVDLALPVANHELRIHLRRVGAGVGNARNARRERIACEVAMHWRTLIPNVRLAWLRVTGVGAG